MTESINLAYQAIDEDNADKSASTRRQMVAGAAVTFGAIAAATLPDVADAASARSATHANSPQKILNIAATAEVLATIVNTVGFERNLAGDAVTQRNIAAAAREELIHYDVLTRDLGGKALTKKIWVPDAVFANRTNFLNALQVGDQIFINAYMIGTTTFAKAGAATPARFTAEFMGAEAVHRALARQSLGLLGNDRAFMKFFQRETAVGAPDRNVRGFRNIETAVRRLQENGFGFGKPGDRPGRFYDFETVSKRTPSVPEVNTRRPN